MRCPSCDSENDPGRKFCVECGARLSAVCASCGTPYEPGMKFCGECGAGLGLPEPDSLAGDVVGARTG